MNDDSPPASPLPLCIRDGSLVDGAGRPILLRGINMTHAWGDRIRNIETIEHLARTGANCVRACFGTFPGGPGKSPEHRRAVVAEYARHGLIAIVEDHDATCKMHPKWIRPIVDAWCDRENVAWLDEFASHAILNIANEWGPPGGEMWCAENIIAVRRLRDAGIRNPLMIDAGGLGQDIKTLDRFARDVWVADELRSVIFSIHLYNLWHTNNWGLLSPFDARENLRHTRNVLAEFGAPLVVSEFTWQAFELKPWGRMRYDTPELFRIFRDLDLGWIAWSWNWNNDAALDMNRGWRFDSEDDLTEWGRLVLHELRR